MGDTSCSVPFIKIGDLISCYYPVLEATNWDDAEAACQELSLSSHLISLDSLEVRVRLEGWGYIKTEMDKNTENRHNEKGCHFVGNKNRRQTISGKGSHLTVYCGQR